MRERETPRPELSKKELYDLAICASAGDETAYQELLDAGQWPIAAKLAEWGLRQRYKWTYGEYPDDSAFTKNE